MIFFFLAFRLMESDNDRELHGRRSAAAESETPKSARFSSQPTQPPLGNSGQNLMKTWYKSVGSKLFISIFHWYFAHCGWRLSGISAGGGLMVIAPRKVYRAKRNTFPIMITTITRHGNDDGKEQRCN